MSTNLLVPALALVLWSLVMLVWMIAMRFPVLMKMKLSSEQSRGGRGSDLDRILPREINWPAHNYIHLMEQPTIFYATIFALVLLGQGTPLNVGLAWAYVGLRIVHSFWQAKINTIPVRATLFLLFSGVLIVLAANGFIAALNA
ncbi:hypothetical protein FHS91_002594 [Sphingobium xanthum]|jgi:hypothetical protein|uniref:MAPEG family protein n=1 Tax=Sphingobium xanthum TaxID=1387165 RepID=UPI001C8B1EB1|nr:MAPEG family protein [Sphingobium xanthum]